MKSTLKIKVKDKKEYKEFTEMLIERGFKQIGTILFEDRQSYIRVEIEK